MKQKVITARVTGDIYEAIADRAKAEGVSLSTIAARLLAESLAKNATESDKPAWAIEIERRLSQLEAQPASGRKGKRR